MNCTFAEKVSALIDGELASEELLSVERHLLACNECQELRADFMNLRSEISSYPLPAVTPLPARLARRVSSHESSPRPAFLDRLTAVFQNRQAALFAAAVLLVVLGLAVWLSIRSQRQAPATELLANSNANSSKRRPTPTPSPAASPQPTKPPKVEDRDADEAPAVPRKFRLPEAITALPSKRLKAPQKSPEPEAANEADSAVIATKLDSPRVGPADTESLTAQHVEQSEVLLRSFRNLRPRSTGDDEMSHERRRAQKLFYQNVMLRREADSSGDIEVASLLQSLEPILLDIANLPQDAPHSEVRAIKDRVERQNLVALLQINSRAQAAPTNR